MSGNVNTSSSRRTRRSRRGPLDASGLRDLAFSYVAKFATTGAKLETYLQRKIRERGVATDPDGRELQLDIAGLVAQFVARGYVDDEAYARAKSRDLAARGYGARRVEQALWAAGVEDRVRSDQAPSIAAQRRAAMVMARKRGFGPFANSDRTDTLDPKLRDKHIAAMLRAGHDFEIVRFIVHSACVDEVEQWVSEAEHEQQASKGNSGW